MDHRVIPEDLFVRYFLPLYPPDSRADLQRARTVDANPGKNAAIVAHLDEAANRFVTNAVSLFGKDVARGLELDRSDASVHRLSAALTAERRDAWATQGAPGSAENALFNAVVHGAAYVGSCVVARHGGVWSVRRPLWESLVRLRPTHAGHAGEAELAVFHWWLKSLADDAVAAPNAAASTGIGGATLADRYRTHVEVPCARPSERSVLVTGERPLPRLKQTSYDLLFKYMRAHLPELRDLGNDFPSPERFAAYAFKWIDFHVLGGGRLVLLAGLSAQGLHLFWLGASGFEKSAYLPCEAFPEPIVRVKGDRIVVLTNEGGGTREQAMPWWGP